MSKRTPIQNDDSFEVSSSQEDPEDTIDFDIESERPPRKKPRKEAQEDRPEIETQSTKKAASENTKKRIYEFTGTDVETIEKAIIQFGCDYKVICWEHYFKNVCSQNKLKAFISSSVMKKVKEAARAGRIPELKVTADQNRTPKNQR